MSLRGLSSSGPRLLAFVEFTDLIQGVDLGKRLVGPQPDNARKAQGIAARVAHRALNIVERDLQHHRRLYAAAEAFVFHGVLAEKVGEPQNLRVRQAGVRLADRNELVAVPDRERVVRELAVALAVPV